MVKSFYNFLFVIHIITEAKQSNRQGRARAVDLPARSFDLARPGVAPHPGLDLFIAGPLFRKKCGDP